MFPNIYIDPAINMISENEVTIIIYFKTQPAHVAVAAAKASGIPLTLEQAEQDVKNSHFRFQRDLDLLLGRHQIPYKVTNSYTTAVNGVALRLPANKIPMLLQSHEIAAIYANKEYKIEPPYQQM